MADYEIAAKRHKKRKTYCFYAPFASFRGYSFFPLCSLCCGLFSITLIPVAVRALAWLARSLRVRSSFKVSACSVYCFAAGGGTSACSWPRHLRRATSKSATMSSTGAEKRICLPRPTANV